MSDTQTSEPKTKLNVRQRLWGLSVTSLVVLAVLFGLLVLLDLFTGSGLLFLFAVGWGVVAVGLVAIILVPFALLAFLRKLTSVVPTWWRYKQSEKEIAEPSANEVPNE